MVKRNLLQSLTDTQKIEILRKNWFSHDARWQYATFLELGIEKGNKINYKVSNQIGSFFQYYCLSEFIQSLIKDLTHRDKTIKS